MSDLPRRTKETIALIDGLRAKAARRHRRNLAFLITGGAAILILIVTLAVLAANAATSSEVAQSTTTLLGATGLPADPSTTLLEHAPLTAMPDAEPWTTSTESTASATTGSTTTERASSRTLVVVIDPGHQAKADSSREPIGPGSTQTKAKVSSGTRSVNTGSPESELVLAVALKLRNELEARGIQVVMTRTTQDVNISNSQRAQIANEAGADLFVRIHADGANDASINGILMLYPAIIVGWTDDIAAESKRAAQLALEYLLLETGAHDRGLIARDDITGFNWSDVPVILPEIGLMTNPAEDALLATPAYQDKIVLGLTKAILSYLGVG